MIELLIATFIGGTLTLTGGALGVYVASKLIRPYDPVFRGHEEGAVFSADEWELEDGNTDTSAIPENIQKRTQEFVDQFAARLG